MHMLTADTARSFEDGLKLVKLRGESMQAAADATPSAMVSVIGLDADKVLAITASATVETRPSHRHMHVALALPARAAS